jgi:lipid-A-disaccharide synthase
LRTVADLASGPLYVAGFMRRRGALRAEIAADLNRPAAIDEPPALRAFTQTPRLFLSCAEPSGELHALNFLRELRQMVPGASVSGLGGAALASAGVSLLGDPVTRATMGFGGIVESLPFYVGLLNRCAEHFRSVRPDVAVLVDSPALHVPLGRIAREFDVPVLHFVTPQHWAWAPWRADGYARAIDRALTILPFEPAWFARRGVPVAHVGHPLLDELAQAPVATAPGGGTTLAVLPGSRASVIDLNLPWMLSALAALRDRLPGIDVAVVQAGDRHVGRIERHVAHAAATRWARIETGDLHASLSHARAALSVSGTVLLDILHHRLPTVCVYRVASRRGMLLYRHALLTPYFASVNLLAGREVMPEFCFRGRGPLEAVLMALRRSYEDENYRRELALGFDVALDRLGPPGACRRAALHALDLAARRGG